MKTRILTGAILSVLVVAFFLLRQVSLYFFDFFVAGILICSATELSMNFNKNKRFNNNYLVITFPVLVYVLILTGLLTGLQIGYIIISIVALFIVYSLVDFVINLVRKNKLKTEFENESGSQTNLALRKTGNACFLFAYPTLLMFSLFIINHIEKINLFSFSGDLNLGILFILLIFATSVMTDTCAYFIGSSIGGPKLCPKISPNKTISGAVGGMFGSVFITLILFAIFNANASIAELFLAHNINVITFLIYALVASIFTQFGDIFASAIKRKIGIKDFGNIFPGHGGFMDRLDGISFNCLISFIFILILF